MKKINEEFIVIAKFIANADKLADLLKALYSLLEPTRKESGCLSYELHQSLDQPRIFTMIEKFMNREAAEFHIRQPYFIAFKDAAPKIVESMTIDAYKIADIPSA